MHIRRGDKHTEGTKEQALDAYIEKCRLLKMKFGVTKVFLFADDVDIANEAKKVYGSEFHLLRGWLSQSPSP